MRRLIIGLLLCYSAGAMLVGNATKTVTTAGTAVPLASSSTMVVSATIQALATNTGTVCIGGSTVLAASKNGTCLTAGQAMPLYAVGISRTHDLAAFYVDSAVNGEGVGILYEY